jgi:hypothetical protein
MYFTSKHHKKKKISYMHNLFLCHFYTLKLMDFEWTNYFMIFA